MKEKQSKIPIILALLIGTILAVLVVQGVNGGLYGSKSPIYSYKNFHDLQRSVSFEFMVPPIVGNATNTVLKSYNKEIIEVISDDFTFRAGRVVAEGADISGDYSEYEQDIHYISQDKNSTARYRCNGENTLLNINSSDIAYSIKFNTEMDPSEAFDKFGINFNYLEEIDSSMINNTEGFGTPQENNKLTETTANNITNTDEQGELSYYIVNNTDFGASFMLPELQNKPVCVDSSSNITILLGNKVIFIIEKYESGYEDKEFNGYTVLKIDDNILVRYVLNNEFEKGSALYQDYYTLVENVNIIKDTFKLSS